jgi:hypothetical protein
MDEMLSTFNQRRKKMKSEKGHLKKSHQHRGDLTGEHAFSDWLGLV